MIQDSNLWPEWSILSLKHAGFAGPRVDILALPLPLCDLGFVT